MPASVWEGGASSTWTYDANYSRAKYATPAKTVIYLREGSGPTLYQKITKSDGTVQHRNVIAIGKRLVAQVTTTVTGGNSTTQTHYLHGDALNSITLVTDQNAQVVERFFYDAYGKRRQSNGLDAPAGALTSQIVDFGFTGHEQLDDLKLVHMNGRIYDAYLGRFISADPYYQDAGNAQSFNRYSYVLNNPLRYTDPSGFNPDDFVETCEGKISRYKCANNGGGGGNGGNDGVPSGRQTVTLDGDRTNVTFQRDPPPPSVPLMPQFPAFTITFGASIRIPSWVSYIFPGYIGQGAGFGTAIQVADGTGFKPNVGIFGTVQGGGSDIGIGRGAINFGAQASGIDGIAGRGFDYSAHWGMGGATWTFNNSGSLSGASFNLGPGYNIGGAGSITGACSIRGGCVSGPKRYPI